MSERPGFGLRGRTMLHPPWSRTGKYSVKDGRRISLFPCAARAVINTVTAFQKAGGAVDELAGLLNNHFPAGYEKIDFRKLAEPGLFYSYEFQFYLIWFTKYLLDDPHFRYLIDEETQLPDYHGPLEQGKLLFAPWIIDDGSEKSGYISITNVTVLFYYLEDEWVMPDIEADQAVLGRSLSEDAILYLNSYIPEKYKMDRGFLNKEGVLISFEFMCLAVNLLRALANDESFTSDSFYFGFKSYSTLAKAIFLRPELSLEESFQEWQLRTNNLYNMEFRSRRRCFRIRINLRKQVQTGMFGIYRENAVGGIMRAVPSAHRAFVELSVMRKTQVGVYPVKGNQYSYWIKVGWKHTARSIAIWGAAVLLGGAVFTAIYLSRDFLSSGKELLLSGIFSATLCSGVALMGLNWRARLKSMKMRFSESKEVISRQLDSLKKTTNELLAERDALDIKVRERTSELNEALEKLKEADRTKTSFIANVSHELRTPLTLLSVPLEGIINGRYGNELKPDHHVFGLIERNVKRLNVQISQLLDFSRLDLGTISFTPERIDLAAYCRLLLAELDSLAERKNLYLKMENRTSLDKVIVSADESLLETMLLNLLNNALKFTDKGGITLVLLADFEPGSVRLCVEDTGIGFPSGQKDRLFQRFTQADESGERCREGVGLGLAIVNEITDRHGWELDGEGSSGQGSVFTVKMPLCEALLPIDADGFRLNENKTFRYELAGSGLFFDTGLQTIEFSASKDTILIVEDNTDMGTVIQEMLEDEFNVKWCTDGYKALEWLETLPRLSLIICDVMMPGINGFRFREELLKYRDYRDLPFVYLTALAESREKKQGLRSGAVDYIKKPFTVTELILKARNLIDTHKASYLQAVRDQNAVERLASAAADYRQRPAKTDWNAYGITQAEERIIKLVQLGLQDKEIAAELSVSTRTVSSHLSHLYRKTDTQNRVELLNKLNKSN